MNRHINNINLLLQFSVSHHVKKIYDEASYLASCLLVETSSTKDFQSISELIERITINRQEAGEIENENRSLVKLQNILNELKLLNNLQTGKYTIFDQHKLFFLFFIIFVISYSVKARVVVFRGIKWEHWPEMDYNIFFVTLKGNQS